MEKKKSKMLKKIIAFFLATLILCSSIPMQVFAAGINLGQQVSRNTINVKIEKKYGHEIHTTKVNGEKPLTITRLKAFVLAGAEGLEPSARGFGDRCSTN